HAAWPRRVFQRDRQLQERAGAELDQVFNFGRSLRGRWKEERLSGVVDRFDEPEVARLADHEARLGLDLHLDAELLGGGSGGEAGEGTELAVALVVEAQKLDAERPGVRSDTRREAVGEGDPETGLARSGADLRSERVMDLGRLAEAVEGLPERDRLG